MARFLASFLILASSLAFADQPVAGADPAAVKVSLEVGRSEVVSSGGQILQVICDDTSVVSAERVAVGLKLTALKPGATLCSVLNVRYLKQLYAVTVAPKPPPPPTKPAHLPPPPSASPKP